MHSCIHTRTVHTHTNEFTVQAWYSQSWDVVSLQVHDSMSQSTNNGGGSLQCHHPIYSVVGEVSPHEVQGFRLQCVAVCCSVSQCVAVCRSVSVVGEVSPHDVQELSSRSPACFEWRLAALGAIATWSRCGKCMCSSWHTHPISDVRAASSAAGGRERKHEAASAADRLAYTLFCEFSYIVAQCTWCNSCITAASACTCLSTCQYYSSQLVSAPPSNQLVIICACLFIYLFFHWHSRCAFRCTNMHPDTNTQTEASRQRIGENVGFLKALDKRQRNTSPMAKLCISDGR